MKMKVSMKKLKIWILSIMEEHLYRAKKKIHLKCKQRLSHNHHDFNIKIDIPNFEGCLQLNKFIDYLHTNNKSLHLIKFLIINAWS